MTSTAVHSPTAPHAAPPAHVDPDFGTATNGKIGMWIFLVTDGLTFGGLLLGYGYLRIKNPGWPNPAEILGIQLTALATFILICSSLSMVLSLAAGAEGRKRAMLGWLAATALGGASFLGIQVYEYTHLAHAKEMVLWGISDQQVPDNFASTFYMITGFHGLHVFTGVTYLVTMLVKGALRRGVDAHYLNLLEIAGLFWHFVDLVWILVFTFIYLI